MVQHGLEFMGWQPRGEHAQGTCNIGARAHGGSVV